MTKVDYPWIRAWGRSLGSFDYYIDGQVRKARKDRADEYATYKRDDGTWATVDSLNEDTFRQLIIIADRYGYIDVADYMDYLDEVDAAGKP